MVRVQPPPLFPPPRSQSDGKVSVQVLTTAGAAAFRLRTHPDADVSSLLREASQRMRVSRGSLSFTHGGKVLREDRKLRSEVPGIAGDERPLPPSLVIHVRAEAGVSRHGVSRPTAYTFGTAGLTGKKPARSLRRRHAEEEEEGEEEEDDYYDDYDDDGTPRRARRSPRPERYATQAAFEEKARQRRLAFDAISSRASSAARVAFSPASSESSHGGRERPARRRLHSAPAHGAAGAAARGQLRRGASDTEEDWTEASDGVEGGVDGVEGGVDWAEAAEMAAELASELAAKATGAAGPAGPAEVARAAGPAREAEVAGGAAEAAGPAVAGEAAEAAGAAAVAEAAEAMAAVEKAQVAEALAESWAEMDGRVEARAKVEARADVDGLQAQVREMQAALRRSDAERTELQRRNARLQKDTRRAAAAAQAVVRPAYAALREHEAAHRRRQEEMAIRHEEKERERRASALKLTQALSAERAQRDARAVDAAVRRTIRATRGAPPPLRAEPGARGSRLHARGRAGHPPEPSEGKGAVGLRGRSVEPYEQQEAWYAEGYAAAASKRGEHRTAQDEQRAWLEQLAALPGPSSETGADGGLRQMLTEALGEEVHRALLTELLTQKAAQAQPAG